MALYYIYIGTDARFEVRGSDAACVAYNKAREFAETLGLDAYLIDGETGEILAGGEDE